MRGMCGGPCGVAFIQIPSMLCMAGLFCFDSSLKQARVFQSRRIATHALHVWRTLLGLHSNEKLGLALRALVFFVFSLPLSKLA